MTETEKPRIRGRYASRLHPEQRALRRSVRMTEAEWHAFQKLGGGQWLRQVIQVASQL